MPSIPHPTTLQDLRRVAQDADDAWSALLQQRFGKRAGDARYDERGRSTPELAAARNALHVACAAVHVEWRKTLIYPNGFEPAKVAS